LGARKTERERTGVMGALYKTAPSFSFSLSCTGDISFNSCGCIGFTAVGAAYLRSDFSWLLDASVRAVEERGVRRCDGREGIDVKASMLFEAKRFEALAVVMLDLGVYSNARRGTCREELKSRCTCFSDGLS